MSFERDFLLANILARLAHKDQKYGKHDYYEYHVKRVYARLDNDELFLQLPQALQSITRLATILHDVVEDTDVTNEEIDLLFGGAVAHIVDCLTYKPKEETREQYYTRVLSNICSCFGKRADSTENMENCISERNLTKAQGYEVLLKRLDQKIAEYFQDDV